MARCGFGPRSRRRWNRWNHAHARATSSVSKASGCSQGLVAVVHATLYENLLGGSSRAELHVWRQRAR
eukprot:13559658-Alexandrium_andersonii.AAC.1